MKAATWSSDYGNFSIVLNFACILLEWSVSRSIRPSDFSIIFIFHLHSLHFPPFGPPLASFCYFSFIFSPILAFSFHFFADRFSLHLLLSLYGTISPHRQRPTTLRPTASSNMHIHSHSMAPTHTNMPTYAALKTIIFQLFSLAWKKSWDFRINF